MLRLWGLLCFDIEVFFPHDSSSSPRGYHKQKTKEFDQSHVMTAQSLLEEATLHRLESGVWTSVRFGDMRRALSACVRLILLQTDPKELRDYGDQKESSGLIDNMKEEAAMEKLMIRLKFPAQQLRALVMLVTFHAISRSGCI
ncbi:hypothetical protein K7X08_009579 [Anisodus acutangulus]|uniref:Uncharacterized protein n=1 Tax=Anisodus acutangulus TaxID=402998 RepID=A0A9Q1RUX4_9SOLA|nr:hypothetical protein K7X08_009579 [Anisodus acutangulus]